MASPALYFRSLNHCHFTTCGFHASDAFINCQRSLLGQVHSSGNSEAFTRFTLHFVHASYLLGDRLEIKMTSNATLSPSTIRSVRYAGWTPSHLHHCSRLLALPYAAAPRLETAQCRLSKRYLRTPYLAPRKWRYALSAIGPGGSYCRRVWHGLH